MSTSDFPYFGSETFNSPYYSQSTADWSPSCIDPSATQPPWVEALQSPPYLNPSRTTPSSHSDSEHSLSFRCSPSAASAAARLSPTPQLPIEGRRAKVTAESAASPSVVRDAILHILHSPEWEQQEEVPGDMLTPIVEAIHFPNGGRSGSRGGIDRYKCLFGTCAKVIKRRDHMLNHVRCHLGLKPWICSFISADAHKQWSGYFAVVPVLPSSHDFPLVVPVFCGWTTSNVTCAISISTIWMRAGTPPSSLYFLSHLHVLEPISPSPTASSRSAVRERAVGPNPTLPKTPPTMNTGPRGL